MKNSNFNRRYTVQISADGTTMAIKNITIERITRSINASNEKLRNEYEYVYALIDIIDKVLDLKEGENMYFNPHRDDATQKGLLTRTN